MSTGVERRAGLAGFSEAVFWVGATAFRLRHRPGERPRTSAHLYCAVAGGAHVCVHAHAAVHVDGQAWRALAAERALGVHAAAVHTDARRLAFVNVCQSEAEEIT